MPVDLTDLLDPLTTAVVTSECQNGVLGPQSNAHGPNEFLHIDAGKRLTAAVAGVVAAVR